MHFLVFYEDEGQYVFWKLGNSFLPNFVEHQPSSYTKKFKQFHVIKILCTMSSLCKMINLDFRSEFNLRDKFAAVSKHHILNRIDGRK
jgi:hypothetical protein